MGDRKCKRLMDGVLATCDPNQCNQEACKDNLQKFYRNAETKWAMDVAFCLCKLVFTWNLYLPRQLERVMNAAFFLSKLVFTEDFYTR